MQKSVSDACFAGWQEIALKANRAVVFIDVKAAGILHWFGGIGFLLNAGAEDVRDFSSFESGKDGQKKAVFVVSSPLEGTCQQILHDIITQSQFQYVIVITTAHPLLHSSVLASDSDNSNSLFPEFEELLQQFMGNMNYTAEVKNIPLFGCEVLPDFFITPAFSELFPLLSSDLQQISYQYGLRHAKESIVFENLSDLEISHLPDELKMQIRLFASGLHGMFQSMNVKEDIYSLGGLSRLVATVLDNFPPAKARRKTCQWRMSLILVDRTLDFASALTRQTDVLLDKILNTLTPMEGHSTDIRINMAPLCHCWAGDKDRDQGLVLPGCLAPPASHLKGQGHPALRQTSCVMKKQKDALMDINRKLVETATAEKLPLDLSTRKLGRVSAEQLDSTLALFKGEYSLIEKHLEVLQVAMATTQTLKHPSGCHHDSLAAKEKSLLQSIADSEGKKETDEEDEDEAPSNPSVFSILSKILTTEIIEKDPQEREFTLDDFLHLLVYVYSLSDGSGEGHDEDVNLLQDQMVRAVVQDKNRLPPLISAVVGGRVTESILPDQIESLWEKLDALLEARRDLVEFGEQVDAGSEMSPACPKPLLRQMMERIVDPSKPELADIECKSGGLKDLLKSGFGFFKSSAKPRPGDAPLLMVVVLGGVTGSEVKQIKDIVAGAKPGFEVVVGATRICQGDWGLKGLLVKDNINLGCSS